MMLKFTGPDNASNCRGNVTIAVEMLNPAVATSVNFLVNGALFATVNDPAIEMSARLDTLSMGLDNGPAVVTVVTVGNVYTATLPINVNNPRSIYVQSVSGDAGAYVTVRVKLNDFATAANYNVVLNYDTSELLLNASSVTKGAGVPLLSNFTPNTAQQGVLEATVTGSNTFTDSELLTASFQIRHPSAPGDMTDITVTSVSLSNSSGGGLTVAGVDGSVKTN